MQFNMKKILASTFLLPVAISLMSCDGKKNDEVKDFHDRITGQVHAELPQSLAGNYLAARFAVGNNDLEAADYYFKNAIAFAEEDKEFLTERALPSAIGSGDMRTALEMAQGIDLDKPLATSQLAVTALLVEAFKDNDIAQVQKLLPKLRQDGFGRLLQPLMDVWMQVGLKDEQKALGELAAFAKSYPSLSSLSDIHTAFIYDYEGKTDEAAKYYNKVLDQNLSVRSAWIVGQFYERQGEKDKALTLYHHLAEKMDSPFASLIIQRIESGQLSHQKFITAPKDGVAAALYDVASVLQQENSSRLAVLYAQLAYRLAPEDPFTNLLLGDIIASEGAPEQAERFYKGLSQDNDLYEMAQLRLAQLYEQEGANDKAVKTLNALAKNSLVTRQANTEIGDIYRRQENYEAAIPYYTKAIATIDKPTESDWSIFYARGICYERVKNWQQSEADLQKSLSLSPRQPEVLNYLAYSWADSGKNLDKALDMLQSALATAPDDPYITDSVGWAMYKTGRYEDAVPYLEAAVQQLPDDPTINDHLGDIYWRVGRKLEAQFQWERALKHVSVHDDDTKKQLEAKLKNGLPDATDQTAQQEQ